MSELQADQWEKEKLVKTKTQNMQKQYEDRIENLHVNVIYFIISKPFLSDNDVFFFFTVNSFI